DPTATYLARVESLRTKGDFDGAVAALTKTIDALPADKRGELLAERSLLRLEAARAKAKEPVKADGPLGGAGHRDAKGAGGAGAGAAGGGGGASGRRRSPGTARPSAPTRRWTPGAAATGWRWRGRCCRRRASRRRRRRSRPPTRPAAGRRTFAARWATRPRRG